MCVLHHHSIGPSEATGKGHGGKAHESGVAQ